MTLFKLDAVESTNDFLKDFSQNEGIENFTVVSAENQTNGKGQRGAVWNSEAGKNLIMSILIKDFILDTTQIFNLNIAVSLAVMEALRKLKIPELSIKWPNDIMSGNNKIGGILVENIIKSDGTIVSIVGLGLNVNQMHFENLPKASSLAIICKTHFDKEELLFAILEKIKILTVTWKLESKVLRSNYIELLFKKGVLMPFQDSTGLKFMGYINGITPYGRLQITKDKNLKSDFDIKEIQMLY